MLKVERSITIDQPIETVFEYLADPRHFQTIWPSVAEIKDVKPLPEGRYKFYHVCYMAGWRFAGDAEIVEVVPQKRIVYTITSGDTQDTMTLTFDPVDKATKVALALAGTIPVPLLNKLPEPLIKPLLVLEIDHALANLKAVLPYAAKTPALR